jgi:hypothetical protein
MGLSRLESKTKVLVRYTPGGSEGRYPRITAGAHGAFFVFCHFCPINDDRMTCRWHLKKRKLEMYFLNEVHES